MLIAVSVELADDIGRGFFSQHGSLQGIHDAQTLVAFESAHGLWVEPAWQMFFEQTHHVLAFTLTWADSVRIMNAVYVGGHVFVTLAVALWVYFFRRQYFPYLRNTLILTNLFALFIYESFPVAPPRMTYGLTFNHHPFTFQDTMLGIIQTGQRFVGTQASGYNEFSAMPSIHMAWALLAGFALVLLARPLWAKALGVAYPILMLLAVVVTGNHYLLDAVGAVLCLVVAGSLAFVFDCWRGKLDNPLHRPRLVQTASRSSD